MTNFMKELEDFNVIGGKKKLGILEIVDEPLEEEFKKEK